MATRSDNNIAGPNEKSNKADLPRQARTKYKGRLWPTAMVLLVLLGAWAILAKPGYCDAQETKKKAAPPQLPEEISQEEQQVRMIFEAFAAALENDPESADTAKLAEQLDEAIISLEQKMSGEKQIVDDPATEKPKKQEIATTEPDEGAEIEDRTEPTGDPCQVVESLDETEGRPDGQEAGQQQQLELVELQIAETIKSAQGPEDERPSETEEKIEPRETIEPGQTGEDQTSQQEYIPTNPDDIVKLKVENDLLDLNMLIETIGRELKFTFLYSDEKGVSGRVKLQQFGEIRRKDLMPLLESMLRFQKLAIIREGSFIRIVKRDEALKATTPIIHFGDELPELVPGDMVVAQIVSIEYANMGDIRKLLGHFTDATTMVQVPNTNYMIITEYAKRLPRLLEMIDLIDQPGPVKELLPIEVEHIPAGDAVRKINELLKALDKETRHEAQSAASDSTTPPQPQPKKRPSRGNRPDRQVPGGSAGTSGGQGPTMFTDERTNRILIVGTEEDIERALYLLELLDVPQPGDPIRVTPISLEYVHAEDVLKQLVDIIKAINAQEPDQPAAQAGAKPPKPDQRTPQDRQRRPSTTRPRSGSSQMVKTVDDGAFLLADERIRRLIVVGTDDQIAQINELLDMLDIPQPGPPIRVVPIQIQHVYSADVLKQLVELVEALNDQEGQEETSPGGQVNQPERRQPRNSRRRFSSGRSQNYEMARAGEDGPFLLADERTNRLIIVGSEEQLVQVTDLLTLLDIPPYEYERAYIRSYRPIYVEAAEALNILDQLEITKSKEPSARERSRQRDRDPDRSRQSATVTTTTDDEYVGLPGQEEFEVRVAVQESLNRLFVLATERQHTQIEKIMFEIDEEPNDALGAIQVYFLENRDPEDVAAMLGDLLESEKTDVEQNVRIPGKEGAPIIVSLADIYAVAVRGSTKQHKDIKAIIDVLDKRLPQVLVEAILVQVNAKDALDLGVALQEDFVNTEGVISVISPFGIAQGASVAFFDDGLALATLEAIQTRNDGKVVSKPRILVNDNEIGTIRSDRKEPTTKSTIQPGSDTPIVTFDKYVEAGTTLEITPHISEGDFLQLEIKLTVNSFDGEGTANVPPPISNNEINTMITVPNDKTIILGGLVTHNDALVTNKVPILGDIPLLGAAFRNVSHSEIETVLYVFVKAQIVRHVEFEDLEDISERDRARLRVKERAFKTPVIPGIEFEPKKKRPSVLDD